MKTSYRIENGDFYINGVKTYEDGDTNDKRIHGLLFNTRFIQGVFDDENPDNIGKYDRFGRTFDAEENTDKLIEALAEWYEAGVRAITVGLQGGGPIFTYDDWSVIHSGCFSEDGKQMNEAYKRRLLKILHACDNLGILVIVSFLYQAQEHLFHDGTAMVEAVRTASTFLEKSGYENIIIEVANEHNVGNFSRHPIINSGEGIASLIKLAREWSGGKFAVGASGGGGFCTQEVIENSDVILVHGNGLRRQEYYDFIRNIQKKEPFKPIVCNEDSQMFSQLEVAYATHTSWGYYNNFTKQEPPSDWGITPGEDEFFARRLKDMISGKVKGGNEFYLQGFEPEYHINGNRYIKLASLYPEEIDHVDFYQDETLLYTSFAEPFMLYSLTTWEQEPYRIPKDAREFTARIYLHDGSVISKTVKLTDLYVNQV